MEDNKKKGLGMVLEGGGMRGLYTAGVLDELMEQGIYADSTVGVSAGAIFGCNYKSRQIGRTLRYNTRFCKDKRYMGLKSWITTGDDPNTAWEKAKGQYGRVADAVKIIDPRKE